MENIMQIPFSPPDISEAEVKEVAEALRSGWITTGPRTKELEKRCAAWIDTPKCVCLNSQTACAEMTLRLLGVGGGLLLTGIGLLAALLGIWIAVHVLPALFRGVVDLCRRLFHRKGGN